MEKLNDYLQQLLSSCSEELHLEPDRNPYLVSANQTIEVANVPLMGTQISTMVFPLIPPDAKSALPHSDEVEFVHPHNLGNFNFTIHKSPSGFNVTIRPLLGDSSGPINLPSPLPPATPTNTEISNTPYSPAFEPLDPEPESASLSPQTSYDLDIHETELHSATVEPAAELSLSGLLSEEKEMATEYFPDRSTPEIEIVSVNDPEYQTVFSDNAAYEPPGRRDDFGNGEYVPPPTYADETPQEMSESLVEMRQEAPAPLAASVTPATQPVEAAFVPAAANSSEAAKMDALFIKMAELGASDLHLSVSMPPLIRKDGRMKELNPGMTSLTPNSMCNLLTSIMPARNQEEFATRSDTDFAYEIPGLARFRCNIFMDRKGMGAVFRIIPSKILTAEQLGLSKAIMDLCTLSKGLVVVTGPTGSGKSTTLCAMVDSINKSREDHIITIEDPIEFVHDNQKCLVNQREVHNHTDSFKDALRAALREDPDIVLVGEMRDLETISIAIETAETGHLVFGTLHTTTAPSTVDRIIDQFPADRQQQIRVMLSESLKGVIAQTLLPKKGGGRVAALEVLIVTPAISNLIREGKTFQIPSAMQTGKNHGMVMLNEALFEHVQNGTVEPVDAYIKAVDKTGFETMLTRGGFKL